MSTVDEGPKDLVILHGELRSPPLSRAARVEVGTMDKTTQKAIEAAGFHITTVREFLDLTDAESELIELRVAISRAVRAKRESAGVTPERARGERGVEPAPHSQDRGRGARRDARPDVPELLRAGRNVR